MMNKVESRPHLVLFGWKDDYIEFVSELNIKVTLVQYPFLLSSKHLKYADKVIITQMGQEDQVESTILKLNEIDPITAMVTFYPTWLVFVSKLGEALNVKCNALAAVEHTRFKDRFRNVLLNSKKTQMRWEIAQSPDNVKDFYKKIGNDIIVKPIAGGGSAGVFKMTNISEFEFAYRQARDVPYWANMEGLEGVLLEEFIEGKEYSIETMSYDGKHKILAVVEKITTGPPNFIEIAHITPTDLTAKQFSNIEEVVFEMLELIQQENGPCHTEVKLRGDVPYIIESQTRFGGDQIWELVWLTTGYHAGVETIAHLCGSPQLISKPKAKAACVFHFIPAQEEITILDIEGMQEAKNSTGVQKFNIKEFASDKTINVNHSGDRLGFVLITGESREECLSNAEKALDKIKLKTNLGYTKFRIK